MRLVANVAGELISADFGVFPDGRGAVVAPSRHLRCPLLGGSASRYGFRFGGQEAEERQCSLWSVSAEDEGLDRQHLRLDAQQQGMHQPDRIHPMQDDAPEGAGILRCYHVVVAGIGVGDAA